MGLLWIMTGINPKPVLCNLMLKCGFSDYDLWSYRARQKNMSCRSNWLAVILINYLVFKSNSGIPCDQSNSWSTPQTSLNYSLNPQRHSDMCALRQPLSPLYDEPCSPEINSLDETRVLVSGSLVSLISKPGFIFSHFNISTSALVPFIFFMKFESFVGYLLLIHVLMFVLPDVFLSTIHTSRTSSSCLLPSSSALLRWAGAAGEAWFWPAPGETFWAPRQRPSRARLSRGPRPCRGWSCCRCPAGRRSRFVACCKTEVHTFWVYLLQLLTAGKTDLFSNLLSHRWLSLPAVWGIHRTHLTVTPQVWSDGMES